MARTKLSSYLLAAIFLLASCTSNDTTQTAASGDSVDSIGPPPDTAAAPTIADSGTADTAAAGMIRKTLTTDVLKDDFAIIPAEQRKFNYQAFDLNNDEKDEYFVSIVGPYFCGSGGCSAWLFDNSGKLINRFTVLDFPIYVAATTTDGWQDLIMTSDNKFRYVKRKDGKYPSNPSVQPVYKGDPPASAPQLLNVNGGTLPEFAF